jgi:hypothetical protein
VGAASRLLYPESNFSQIFGYTRIRSASRACLVTEPIIAQSNGDLNNSRRAVACACGKSSSFSGQAILDNVSRVSASHGDIPKVPIVEEIRAQDC